MDISITPADFVGALKFLTTYYTPVRLQDVLGDSRARQLPARPVLVTFDDGYASTLRWAVPLCRKLGVPAVFFLSAAFLDNERLAPDNLVCYVANRFGLGIINEAARRIKTNDVPTLNSLAEVFSRLFPMISLADRNAFLEALITLTGIDEAKLASEADLYLTRKELREVASSGFEIGNHTYTHVRCRVLTPGTFASEIDRNKTQLEALTGNKVRSFSVPYGSSGDLPSQLATHLRQSGYQAVFLSESVANDPKNNNFLFDRVGICSGEDDALFSQIEVLPRLRAVRNRLISMLSRTAA